MTDLVGEAEEAGAAAPPEERRGINKPGSGKTSSLWEEVSLSRNVGLTSIICTLHFYVSKC